MYYVFIEYLQIKICIQGLHVLHCQMYMHAMYLQIIKWIASNTKLRNRFRKGFNNLPQYGGRTEHKPRNHLSVTAHTDGTKAALHRQTPAHAYTSLKATGHSKCNSSLLVHTWSKLQNTSSFFLFLHPFPHIIHTSTYSRSPTVPT